MCRRAYLGLALLLVLAGCGKVVPRPEPKAAARPAHRAPAAPAEGASAAQPQGRALGVVWREQTVPFNQALAIADDGRRVAVLSSRLLSVRGAASGGELAQREVCATFGGALAFVTPNELALVCEDAIHVFGADDLAPRGQRDLEGEAQAAAFGAGRVAIGFASGPIRILETDGSASEKEIPVDHPVTALALSADGARLAIGLAHGDVVVRGLADDSAATRTVQRGMPIDALAFSPDGGILFVAAGPATVFCSGDGAKELSRLSSLAGVRRAVWLGQDELATAGRDGLLSVRPSQGTVKSIGGGSADGSSPVVSLAASRRGDTLCAAEREGAVTCLSRHRRAVTSRLVLPDLPGGPGAERSAGRVVSLVGSRLGVRALPGAALPDPETHLTVLRYTEQRIGDAKSARWLEVAKGKVFKVDGDVVFVRIDEGVRPIVGVDAPLADDTPVRLIFERVGSAR